MNRFQDILILKYVLHCLSYIYHVYDPLMPTVATELESNLMFLLALFIHAANL